MVLTVTDLEGHSVSLDVVVVSSVLSTDNQRFVWGNMIELNKANNWSLFIDTNSVAITNVLEGRQYVLSCDGDLSVGVKANATLEILSSKTGAEPEIVQLAGMEVLQIKMAFALLFLVRQTVWVSLCFRNRYTLKINKSI